MEVQICTVPALPGCPRCVHCMCEVAGCFAPRLGRAGRKGGCRRWCSKHANAGEGWSSARVQMEGWSSALRVVERMAFVLPHALPVDVDALVALGTALGAAAGTQVGVVGFAILFLGNTIFMHMRLSRLSIR